MTARRLALGIALLSLAALAQSGRPDPVFASAPFDQWMAQGELAQIPWKVQISAHDLSVHQRLIARLRIEVDGKELVKRRGQGELLLLAQLTDREGRAYRTHNSLKLHDVTSETAGSYMECIIEALVVPGEYRVDLVLLDTVSKDHSVARRTLHVDPLKNDPLPESWAGLPPVEFPFTGEAPERWFQPALKGRLHLPVPTQHRVHLEVLVNVTPSEEIGRRSTNFSRSMAFLIPAAKILSDVNIGDGSSLLALLDLSRQRVTFEQEGTRELDWPKLEASFQQADPNKIDVRSLQNREHNAEFFVREISRRMEAAGDQPSVFIVLSAPMGFASDDAPRPVRPPGRNCRVFYIRYSWTLEEWRRSMRDGRVFRRPPRMVDAPELSVRPTDSLEPILKPLAPRVFEVASPLDFRKALAAILAEISRL